MDTVSHMPDAIMFNERAKTDILHHLHVNGAAMSKKVHMDSSPTAPVNLSPSEHNPQIEFPTAKIESEHGKLINTPLPTFVADNFCHKTGTEGVMLENLKIPHTDHHDVNH